MTDTREDCEKAFANYSPFTYSIYKSTDVKRDTSHATSVFNHFTSGWQACEAHYKERIADLLRGHLQNCVNHLEGAQRRNSNESLLNTITRANNCLYKTLHSDQAIAESK